MGMIIMSSYDRFDVTDCRYNALGCKILGDTENQIKFQYGDKSTGRHFVLWSGGCDSTLLLYELIDAYGCENVVAVSYTYPWLAKDKITSESMHRESFKSSMAIINKKFKAINHMSISVDYSMVTSIDGESVGIECGGTPQAVAWLLNIPIFTRDGDHIYLGTLKGDDLPIVLTELQTAVNNISTVLSREIYLRTPYIYLSKEDVIRKLMKYDIYQHTWYCEMPTDSNVRCGKCVPCKTHMKALYSLLATEEDPVIIDKARKEFRELNDLYKDYQPPEKVTSIDKN